jgi:transglutaminase-like putative cysteine protease
MRVSLRHSTRYTYGRPVTISPHVVRLRPAPHTRTAIESYSLRIAPERHFLNWQQDPFGNFQARLVFPEPAASLEVEVDLLADLIAINPFDFFLDSDAERLPVHYEAGLRRELHPYFDTLPLESRLASLVETCRSRFARGRRRTMDVLVDINQHIQRLLRYDIRMEPGVFAPEKTLTVGHGSCRDFAWLSCQVLRHLGFATRFASGYSVQLKPDEKPVEGLAGVAEDVVDLHAWTEVFLPGAGWIGLDATSGLLAGEGLETRTIENAKETPPLRRGISATGVVRTALCVEPRRDILHVFLPPLSTEEAYLELTAAVEGTAAALSRPVRLEGYPPLMDARLDKVQRTSIATDLNGDAGRVCGRRMLSRLATPRSFAPHHRRTRASDFRCLRYLERPRRGRLHVPRVASRWAHVRHPTAQRPRGREPA